MLSEVDIHQYVQSTELPNIPEGYVAFSLQEYLRDHFGSAVRRCDLRPVIYGDQDVIESRGWVEEALYLTRSIGDAIRLAHVPIPLTAESELMHQHGFDKVGDLVGSGARVLAAMIGRGEDEHRLFFEDTLRYRKEIFGPQARYHPLFADPVDKDILNGPFDIGIRVDVPSESVQEYLRAVHTWLWDIYKGASFGQKIVNDGETQFDFQTTMRTILPGRIDLKQAILRLRTKTFSYGKFSIEIELVDPYGYLPTFTLHVSNLDKDDPRNYRLGPHHSKRQEICMAMYRKVHELDWDDTSDLIILSQADADEMRRLFNTPDSILNSRCVSLPQFVYANLRMIWHALNWPPYIYDPQASDYIEARTIQNSRRELNRLLSSNPQGTIPDDVQRQITTLAILCADKDPGTFLQLASALGILDIFQAPRNVVKKADYQLITRQIQRAYVMCRDDWMGKTYPRWDLFQKLGSVYVARLLLGLPENTELTPDDVKRSFMLR